MHLYSLDIDSSKNAARTWLANPYRVHQRLLMAFPDGAAGRVLFRMEDWWERPRILVQAPVAADWDLAFAGLPVLASRPLQKEASLSFRPGQRLRFLLRANPTTRRKSALSEAEAAARKPGKRVGLMKESEQRDWFERKATGGGFRLIAFDARPRGDTLSRRSEAKNTGWQKHICVEYEGHLEVTDPDRFLQTIKDGIGSAKGYGFGMLSVAPAGGED